MTTSTSPSKTPDRPFHPTKSRVCSNHSAGCPPPNDSPTPPMPQSAVELDSDSQSCGLSPTHTVVTSMPGLGKMEVSPYEYDYLRCRRNPDEIASGWNSCNKQRPLHEGGWKFRSEIGPSSIRANTLIGQKSSAKKANVSDVPLWSDKNGRSQPVSRAVPGGKNCPDPISSWDSLSIIKAKEAPLTGSGESTKVL